VWVILRLNVGRDRRQRDFTAYLDISLFTHLGFSLVREPCGAVSGLLSAAKVLALRRGRRHRGMEYGSTGDEGEKDRRAA
jgi:hypothetical protein